MRAVAIDQYAPQRGMTDRAATRLWCFRMNLEFPDREEDSRVSVGAWTWPDVERAIADNAGDLPKLAGMSVGFFPGFL